jgi:arabinofuranan 3-O-arabinosyltransferase
VEPRDRAAEALTPADARFRRRFRLLAWSLVLVASTFAQAPGRVLTDTKLDLTVDPAGFLARAFTLWDPLGSFGQLQNQAYGYLFPMGPFFALGDAIRLPDWVVQRLWWSLLLVVAFLGVVKLCEVLGVGRPWTRVLAGLAFAWSPRFLSVMGASSIEVWPSAVAPWVLVPLVVGLRRGDPRRWAGLSAVSVACVGGVNAAATFAVVPLAVLLLLGAEPGPRRRALLRWWPPLVLLGCLWWLVPLFLLGRYSPPFLDWIESIDNTSFAATLLDALRGTSNWTVYVDANAVAGRELLGDPLLVLNGMLVVGLGLVGLLLRDLPRRGVWIAGVVVGLLVMTAGHQGATSGLLAGDLRSLLDGALAPLRNAHKFDVLVRLPLVLGLCHAVTRATARAQDGAPGAANRVGAAVLACAAVVGATVPGWTGDVAPRKSFDAVPDYWVQAADWLGREADGSTLLLPATPYGDYVWGKTGDEPLQPLASSPWAVRSIVPLTPGGTIQTLDAVSDALRTGRGSQALAAYLRRAGIGTLVLRHDVDRNQGAVSPELVRSTLETTPGLEKVAEFGPPVGGDATFDDGSDRPPFVDGGWQATRPAIEVYELSAPVPSRRVQALDRTPTLVGDPSTLLALDRWGLLGSRSVVLAQDRTDGVDGPLVLTDGNRRQEVAFGAIDRTRSATLTPQEPYRADRRVHRYDEDRTREWSTVPRLVGAESLTATSSRSDVGALPALDEASGPWAALDGDPDTAWRPDAADDGRRSWLRLDLGQARDLGTLSVRLDAPADQRTPLVVEADGRRRTVEAQGSTPVQVDVGTVRVLRVGGTSRAAEPLAVAEVASPALALSRPLRLPEVPAAWGLPDVVALTGSPAQADGCVTVSGVLRCSGDRYRAGEGGRTIDREVPMRARADYRVSIAGEAYGGPALDALLQEGRLAEVAVSSHASAAPQVSAVQVLDGDPTTAWIAAADDDAPTIDVRWVGRRVVDRLRLETGDDVAASAPSAVRLVFGDGSTVTRPVVDGLVRFPRVRTSSVRVQVVETRPRASIGFDGAVRRLPVGVGELSVGGVTPRFRVSDADRTRACGTGPVLSVAGVDRATRLQGSDRDLLDGERVRALPCGGRTVTLDEGVSRVVVGGGATFRPTDVLLTAAEPRPEPVGGGQLLSTTHNENPGWTATRGGTALSPVVVDGWQQGWSAPRGSSGPLEERFAPATTFRAGLLVGALALLSLLLLVALPARPGPRWTRTRPRRPLPSPVTVAVATVVGALLAGLPGAAAAALTSGVVLAVGRRAVPVLVVGGAVVATGFAVLAPWGGSGTWSGELAAPQLAVVVVVAALVASLGRLRSFSRRNGSSTVR